MALELGRGSTLGDKSSQLAWELSRTRHMHAALVRTQTKQPRVVLARAELTGTKQSSRQSIQRLIERDYRWGFASDVESVSIPKGLSPETIRLISAKREEPEWLLNFRLEAYHRWLKMQPPTWSQLHHPPIDFQDMCYYSEPKQKHQAKEEEIDPKILDTYQKLGIPLSSSVDVSMSAGCSSSIAMDAVFDSTSVAITHKKKLEEEGVIFCSISEAVRKYPELVRSYLGRVVPAGDNFYAALNSAVFSDGSFCYVPKNTRPSMDISTQFRINASETGQFERTLIIVDEGGCVNYLEGCTATAYATNQLHAAVVELYCAQGAQINYSTVQNWYSGDSEGRGGIYNFVTKRGICDGDNSKISWTQVETGSAITWKYPSVVLRGENSVGEFYSVALTKNQQQADTGTKMIHLGKNSRSRIVSKGISAGKSLNCYRGLVQVQASATDARNFSQCDSLLIGDNCAANTYPTIQVRNPTARIEHEATTSKVSEDQVFYFQQRGVSPEKAVAAIVGGFCREVVDELPYEFKVELNELLSLKLEGSVG